MNSTNEKPSAPKPLMKKNGRRRVCICQWEMGDIFAYRLESELAKEKGLWGRYFLIQKVDEDIWYPGHIIPIVYVKITADENLPSSVEEYNQLEYVQTSFTKYEDRFLPIDMSRLQQDLEEKLKMKYEMDEYGFLPEYRAKILNTSIKAIPDKLIFIGNFANAIRPPKEFVPHTKYNIISVAWKLFNETFESKLIGRYCGNNRREFGIYQES